MAGLPEELGIEIEALEHLYGPDAFSITSQGNSTTLSMALLPRRLDGDHEAYVAGKLNILVDNSSYPTSPAMAILEDSKGLTDAACIQLQAALQNEALNLVGEMILGHLCELALELITEANHPSGTCVFCLEDVVVNNNNDNTSWSAYHVLKLPCFHCFHIPCFTAWFQWQQAAAAAAAAEAVTMPGQQPPSAGQDVKCENGWIAKNIFTIKCPSCRLEVPPTALRHALPQLLGGGVREEGQRTTTPPRPPAAKSNAVKTRNNNDATNSVAKWSAEHPKAKDVLSPQSLQQLLEMQRRFKQVLELQKTCNGLVQENVAVSVAELEAAAAEKRQQQQQQQQQEGIKQEAENHKESASAPSSKTANRGGGRSGGGGGSSVKGRGGAGRGRGGTSRNRGRGGQPRPPNPPPTQ
jgi:hypothetical protein